VTGTSARERCRTAAVVVVCANEWQLTQPVEMDGSECGGGSDDSVETNVTYCAYCCTGRRCQQLQAWLAAGS